MLKINNGKVFLFDAFVVVRFEGEGSLEIHTVGCSGSPRAELLDQMIEAVKPYCTECELELIGSGLPVDTRQASGFRVYGLEDSGTLLIECLQAKFENVLVAR